MACRTLALIDEVFGPPIEQVVIPRVPVRGEWAGLQVVANTEVTTQVAMVNVRARLDTTGSPMVTVTVPVGGGLEKTIRFPWSPGAPAFTQLNAARFTAAEFLVVKYTASPGAGNPYETRYSIFDLRSPPAGTPAPEPIVIGPSTVPAGVEEQFCPNANGQLVLIWRGTAAAAAQGRLATVYRTEVSPGSFPPLITADDPTALGIIACQVTDNGTAGFDISLHDQAFRQGNTAVSLSTVSRMLQSDSAPKAGRLKLSGRSLTIAPSAPSVSLQITNDGGDFLEVTSVTVTGTTITVTPNAPLPICLLPNESLSVLISRAGSAAGTATVTVATSPPASAGGNTVAVSAQALAAVTAVSVTPRALSWRSDQTAPQAVFIQNSGNSPVDVSVVGPPMGSVFSWAALPTIRLGARATRRIDVSPPPAPPAPVTDTLTVAALAVPAATPLTGFPLAVSLNAGVVARVPPGSLRITTILADAPGDDILGEGEFIEIVNVTSGALDLTGCRIDHTVFTGTSSHFLMLFRFGAAVFGTNSMLPPLAGGGPTLRVLSRRMTPGESTTFRLFAGRRGAVWNNSGDTGRVMNEFGEEVDRYTYVNTPATPTAPLPPGTVYSPTTARTRRMVRRVFVNSQIDWTPVFLVQDGDVINITASGTPHFGGFLGIVGRSGPEGREPAPTTGGGWPLPGAPTYGLIADVGGVAQFFVGAAGTLTINREGGPFMLSLGPNDGVLWDNSGDFDCVVVLYR